MRSRTPAALLLCGLLAAAAPGQTDPKGKDKEPPKEPTKLPEPKWPTEIGGKTLDMVLKDVTNPDPSVREYALKTLPGFGPDIRKACSKILLARMTAEKDPGVRLVVFDTAASLGLEDSELPDAVTVLGTVADTAAPGGLARLHAVQTLGLLGPKAEKAISPLTGLVVADPSYETRRSLANTLGRVGFNELSGPNQKVLTTLAGVLAKDVSAAVRMEALQSLVLLGPPWAAKKANDKAPQPPIDTKVAGIVAGHMKARIGNPKTKTPAQETDKQLEIWCRVVLMRFDPAEINEGHMDAIARHLDPKGELGPKLQALQGLALFGEAAGKKVDDVVKLLKDEVDPVVLNTTLGTLAAMGDKGKPAVPNLEEFDKRLVKLKEERMKEEGFKKLMASLKPEEIKVVLENLPEEQMRKQVTAVIKHIQEAKPASPSPDPKSPSDPPKKP